MMIWPSMPSRNALFIKVDSTDFSERLKNNIGAAAYKEISLSLHLPQGDAQKMM